MNFVKKSNEAFKPAKLMRRQISWSIDYLTLSPFRVLFLSFWFYLFKYKKDNFVELFNIRFQNISNFDPINPDHIELFLYSSFCKNIIIGIGICILIGPLYTFLCMMLKKKTLGHYLTNVYILNSKTKKCPSTLQILNRILVSYLPFVFSVWMIYYFGIKEKIGLSIMFVVLFFWYDLSFFFKKPISVHDIISGTEIFEIKK